MKKKGLLTRIPGRPRVFLTQILNNMWGLFSQ